MAGLAGKFLWSLLSNIIRIVFQFAGIVILGRMLSPDEYGIIGIMTIFMVVGDMLIDSGMNGAILHKREANKEDFSTLFVYNLSVSIFLYAIIYFTAPLFERFYEVSNLSIYIRIYSLGLLAYAIGISQITKLQKNMDFKSLAISSFISNFTALIVAVYLAYIGAGVWALILQYLVSSTLDSICAICFAHMGISFSFSKESFKEQFGFGMWLMISSLFDTISNNIYSNVIPRYGTLTTNGYYSQANRISNVPTSLMKGATSQVLFPALCITEENDKVNVYKHYSRIILYLCCIAFFLVSVYSPHILTIIVGEKWIDATLYLKVLSIACLFEVFQNLQRNYLKSIGKTRIIFQITIIKSIVRLSLLFLSAIIGGLNYIVVSVLISSIINTFITIVYISRISQYTIIEQAKDSLPYLLRAMFATAPLYAIVNYGNLSFVLQICCFPISVILYMVVSLKDQSQKSLLSSVYHRLKRNA